MVFGEVKMWTPLGFLVILIVAASAEFGFKIGNEYKYEINSKTLTSLHQVSQQYSGVFIRAILTIVPVKEDEFTAYISQPEKAQIHSSFLGDVEFDVPQNVVQYTPFTLSKESFIIRLKGGIIDELVISKEIPIWEVNIIRSIVSQLQINTQGKRIIPSRLNTIPQNQESTAVYKVMEDTIEGECEVLYDITPLPKYILQRIVHLAPQSQIYGQEDFIDIMKTKNFSNCEQRPGYHFGITGLTDWEPTTNKMGNFLSRSSVSRIIVSGSLKNYTLLSSVTTNKVILSPEIYNDRKGEVVSQVNLTLTSVQSRSQKIQEPKNPQTLKKLVYDFNTPFHTDIETRESWDKRQKQTIFKLTNSYKSNLVERMRNSRSVDDKTMIFSNKERYQETPQMTQPPETPFLPFFVACEGHSIQHAKEVNVHEVVTKLTEQIGKHLQEQTEISEKNVLDRFSILVRVIRTMNLKQLEQVIQEIYTPENENTENVSEIRRNAWMSFRDALAQAGTGPALVTIINLIATQKIKGEEAAQIISTLPETVIYPTSEYRNTFFELIKKPEVVSQKDLNSSSIYAFTKLVRLSQVNEKAAHNRYPVHAFGYFSLEEDTTVTEVYIPYFAQQLEQSVKEEDSHKIQTYIRALGNIAHPKIIQVFEPYLEGKKPMTDFQRTLIVVSLNKLAMVHPRLAKSILYKIYANTGEVYQVRVAAVYNLMKTNPSGSMLQRMAQFTHEDPSHQVRAAVKAVIESAALLVSETNSELRQNAQSAVNMLVPKVFGIQYSRSNLTDYLVKGLHLSYTQILEYIGSEDSLIPKSVFYTIIGNHNGYKNTFLKVAGMISSVQNLHDLFQDIFVNDEQKQTDETVKPKDQTFTLEKINKILNVEHFLKEQLEGNFAFKFGNMERFFAFDNHTIESLPYIVNKFSELLAKGKVYNYQKMFSKYQVTIGLPTATGLPFVYTLKTPIYVGLKGKVQAEIPEIQSSQIGSQITKLVRFTTNIQVTYASSENGEIGFITPFDHQHYLAGYKKQIQLNIPVKGSISLDVEKHNIQLEIKPVEKKDYKLLHFRTQPFTAIHDVLKFKPAIEGSNTKIIQSKVINEVTTNFGQKYLGMVFRLSAQTEKKNFDFKKIIFDLTQRHDLVSGLLYPSAENFIDNTEIGLYYDNEKSIVQTISMTAAFRQIRSQINQELEGETEKVFQPVKDGHIRIDQFYKKVSSGIKGAVVSVADLSLKVQGQIPSTYVGTVAFARSPIDSLTKLLAFFYKTIDNANYEICFDGEIKASYLSAVDYEKVVQAEPCSEIKAYLKFGEKCESGAKIDFTGKLERSQERRQFLENLPQVQQCKKEMEQGNKLLGGCRNATLQAGLMDKYRFTIVQEKVPEAVKNLTYQVYSILRHAGYAYVTENISTKERSSQNQKIELDVNFSPDLKTANVYISAPSGVAHFRNVHINKYARTLFVFHPVYNVIQRIGWSSLRQQFNSYCTIDKVQTKTFDNQTYSAHIGNVWHVMSMSIPKVDAKGKYDTFYEFSVLIREDSNNHKEVQFVFDYPHSTFVRITPSADESHASVFVNEKQVHFDNKGYYEYRNGQHVVIQAFFLPTGELKIVHPDHGFEFLYDQTRVQLTLSQEHKNRVGGLCGVYNGEHFNFVTPQNYILQDPEEFAATWALSSEGPIGELKKRAKEHSLYKKSVILTNVISNQDIEKADSMKTYYESDLNQEYDSKIFGSEEFQERRNPCTTKRIMVIERDGKHCFSIHPQTYCNSGCQVEKTKTMTTEFICVNKTQTSSHWAQMVHRGAQPNFKNKGNAQKMQFEGPVVCTEA